MDYTFFSQQVSKIKNLPLPGEAAHFKMAHKDRIEELELANPQRKNAKKAGVLALFYPKNANITHLLLILRKTYKGVHSNQIAFPGGKLELQDVDLKETALRETQEEVGVPIKRVKVVKSLSKVYIPPSNFEVHPYLGLYNEPLPFVLQEDEVESIVEVSLTDFMNDANLFEQTLSTSYAKNIIVPAFKLNGYTVWGATAMMLSEVKELLRQVL
ncbi:NUDIX hydrolase [Maribacter sp. 2308TA10-17]|uniref:NUDIX hydrolase n=1 Tax=Maribacter sp. 2308TA10-17 TaxID=3386276 RepID=UPI0039BC3D86